MALLKIPDPNKPPMPLQPYGDDDERIRVLIMTVNMLTKKVDELESKIKSLERDRRWAKRNGYRFGVYAAGGESCILQAH